MSRFPSDPGTRFLHVSVHDVTPDTLPRVDKILRFLTVRGFNDVTLLIVPGCGWRREDVRMLADWESQGYTLAGHGWRHRADRLRGIGHRLHSLFISRYAAEHLAQDEAGVCRIVTDCHAWFVEQGLNPPALYVPPAWAMGSLPRERLMSLPFDHYEYLCGFFDAKRRTFRAVPLIGFEADSWARLASLYPLNMINLWMSRITSSLRIAIHPDDFELLLGDNLRSLFDLDYLRGMRQLCR